MSTADQRNTGAGGVERFDSESEPYAEGHKTYRVGPGVTDSGTAGQ